MASCQKVQLHVKALARGKVYLWMISIVEGTGLVKRNFNDQILNVSTFISLSSSILKTKIALLQ